MEKQRTKLGARILSHTELNAILPNAESVYEQIEVFRENIPEKTVAVGKEVWEQKTNNIGIMGRRGAGKTSILRTFHDGLNIKNEKNGQKDIILPIIIPENMSADTLLMDVVLGMLKSVMKDKEDERKREREKAPMFGGDCIYSGRNVLERKYNELVKRYCYIKKDYRDILIRQFTTEQNYVDKTTLVFNSDTEFINCFNVFIEDLLCGEEKSDAKSMIFLFIDDIDLSTTKCMDVVRTLLSYLSHPRIVTFISGDMENFEEALTLEFLRQEKALNEQVFEKNYFSVTDSEINRDNTTLLNRKKALAYEYLKKIIPPAYRKTIKYWALEERGNYLVEFESKTEKNVVGKGEKVPNLAELLEAVTEGKVEKAYFTYKKDNQPHFMNVSFHMFDDTSRGLNNVYNVLQELYDRKKLSGDSGQNGEENQLMLWRLIETIEDSDLFYAQHKETLRKKIIVLEGNRMRIHFDNAFRMLYGYGEGKEGKGKEGEEVQGIRGFNARERFRIFLLIDFASRLSCGVWGEDSGYGKLKGRIIREYVMDDSIEDKIAVSRNWPQWWRDGKNKADCADIQNVLLKILEQGDFIFDLYMVQFLGRENICNLVSSKYLLSGDSSREYAYKIAYAMIQTLGAMRETEEGQKSYLADLYVRLPNEMMILLSELALNPRVIYGKRLMEETNPGGGRYCSYKDATWRDANITHVERIMDFLRRQNFLNKSAVLRAEYQNECLRYNIYYSMLLDRHGEEDHKFDVETMAQKTVYSGLTVAVMNQLYHAKDDYRVGKLKDAGYQIPVGEKELPGRRENQEKQVIALIDENDMWVAPYVKKSIKPYLMHKKYDYISQMGEGRLIFDATELFESNGAYTELEKCPKGSSRTALAYRLKRQVENILFLSLSEEKDKKERFFDGKYYLRLEQVITIQCLLDGFLRNHPRMRYAKMEARGLLMKMSEIPLVIRSEEWENIHNELKYREDSFFGQVFKGSVSFGSGKENLHDSVMTKFVGEKGLEDLIEKITEEYRGGEEILEAMKNHWLENVRNPEDAKNPDYIKIAEADYFEYVVQKGIIMRLKEFAWQSGNQEGWEKAEAVIPKEEYLFIFHSYLRYLQENDNDAEKAGARAEDIARFTSYMLESEVIADKQIQNDIYELVNDKLGITEEDFNELFNQ